jgi:hypothetical protein
MPKTTVEQMLRDIKALAEKTSPDIYKTICKIMELPASSASLEARGAVEAKLRECYEACARIAYNDFRKVFAVTERKSTKRGQK